MEKDIVNIGKSVVIKGELNGSEDLTIEGNVEGTIQLRDHVLTIGPNGKIKAQVFAKAVIVLGEVTVVLWSKPTHPAAAIEAAATHANRYFFIRMIFWWETWVAEEAELYHHCVWRF